MNLEELLILNGSKMPMSDCHFYKWLSKHGDKTGNRIDNIRAYVTDAGLTLPIANSELLRNLRSIHEFYYYRIFVNSKRYQELMAQHAQL